jgi:hypothetical protein
MVTSDLEKLPNEWLGQGRPRMIPKGSLLFLPTTVGHTPRRLPGHAREWQALHRSEARPSSN